MANGSYDVELEDNAQALLHSFTMIIFSEIGDKTFLIAAILAMRHPRLVVFSGALGSLVAMSALSAALGHLLPALLPKQWTQLAASILFLVFGTKMMMEARQMESGNGKIREEMREAEEEIEGDEAGLGQVSSFEEMAYADSLEVVETGGPTGRRSRVSPSPSMAEGARNFCSLLFGPVFVQSFMLTFLGEWGDRSQIATIALGAAHNVYIVTFGTVAGHACCTALAVVAGRYVSTKISVKHVTFGGATLFVVFGLIYLYEALSMSIPISMEDAARH